MRVLGASPHTRGWTLRDVPQLVSHQGFPAHAGMDLMRTATAPRSRGLPRTRGDGPEVREWLDQIARASPHTRGWTEFFVDRAADVSGFPAHAGMDPATGKRRSCSRRLPRTRGDGPLGHGLTAFVQLASPHTRGWTAGLGIGGRGRIGFPAHAGMDPARPGSRGRGGGLPRTRGDGPRPNSPGRP